MRNGAMLNHSRPRAGVRHWPAYFRALGYLVAAIGKVSHYGHVKGLGFDHASHFNYHQDDCVEAAVKWLAGRKSGGPVCLLIGTNWPHVPWPKEGGPDPDKLTLPPTLVDTAQTRRAFSRYLAGVANADRDLGLILDAVRKHLGENVLFVFTSDHGSQFPFGKWNCYDAGVRTPLLVFWPGRVAPRSTSDALVSWVDLLPTCLEAAGGRPPAGLDGRSAGQESRTPRPGFLHPQRRRGHEPLPDPGRTRQAVQVHPQPRPGRQVHLARGQRAQPRSRRPRVLGLVVMNDSYISRPTTTRFPDPA
jgi:uncharacterized sulfatase